MRACFKRLGEINYRNHMKIALVDNEVVYTGGMNMGEPFTLSTSFGLDPARSSAAAPAVPAATTGAMPPTTPSPALTRTHGRSA